MLDPQVDIRSQICNLGAALARVLDRHHGHLRAAAATAVEVERVQDMQPAPNVSSAPAAEPHAP